MAILIFVTVFGYLTSCAEKDQGPEHKKSGGVLYLGIEVPFHGFDILVQGSLNPPQAPLNNLIMEPLFRRDKAGNLIPIIVLSATPSADEKSWDIQLRQGVFFS
jgi:ABC-type transport system substrate-binding protein